MDRIKKIVQWQHHSSPPVLIGDRLITLQSQALSVRLPMGGLVWNRPSGVLVEQDGVVTRLPIQDVTRSALLAMTLAAACIGLLIRVAGRRGR
jgi:hypothetical protein